METKGDAEVRTQLLDFTHHDGRRNDEALVDVRCSLDGWCFGVRAATHRRRRGPRRSRNLRGSTSRSGVQMKPVQKVSIQNAEHYVWGNGCDGWHFVNRPSLSVIRER